MNVQDLRDNGLILFEAISGSRSYGTNMPNSDTDIRGVFILPQEYILGNGYIEQVADKTNDVVFYEIKRFLQLLSANNPNIIELLNIPEDCIVYKDPVFDLILEKKDDFITKQCKNSFGGYAIQQIKKAKGYNKKINWEEKEMTRKTVLDYCYILKDGQSMAFSKWANSFIHIPSYEDFGLANIDHAHNIYAMYLMKIDEYSGIVSDLVNSNDVQLVSIPKGRKPVAYLTFNKDAYSLHCKRYKEYNEWLNNRNEDRFRVNKDHGKNYDSKNMMHCVRLLDMGYELSNGELNVRRPKEDIKKLMSIRLGEMEYDDLLEMADSKMEKMDRAWEKSSLPSNVDADMVNNLLIKIRKLKNK